MKNRFTEPGRFIRSRHSEAPGAILPVIQRPERYRERSQGHLPSAVPALTRAWPWKKRQYASGTSCFVAVVEVICPGIVEIDSSFDEAKTEEADVEIEVSLGVRGDGSHMVNAADYRIRAHAHIVTDPRKVKRAGAPERTRPFWRFRGRRGYLAFFCFC